MKKKKGIIPALFSLPFFYLSYEVFHYYWDLTYTWIHLGLGFSNSPYFLKVYPFIGQEGGTLYIMTMNMLLCFLFIRSENLKKQITESLIFLILLITPAFLSHPELSGRKEVRVGVLQPEIPHNEVTTNETIDRHFEILKKALENPYQGNNAIRPVGSVLKKPELVICPEGFFKNFHDNPIIINDPHRHSVIMKLKALASEHDVAILSGVIIVKLYFTKDPPTLTARLKKEDLFYDTYNAVMLIEPTGNIQWRSKVKLVPFAERVPFLRYFQSLEALHLDFNESFGSYDYEREPRPFVYKDLIIAPLICYESLYPGVTSLFLERKANLIVEFSNENWTPHVNKGQMQHDSYAMVNMFQFGRDYVRSTYNKGSAVLFHNPWPMKRIGADSGALMISDLKLPSGSTFYTRHRSLWTAISVLPIFLIFVLLFLPKIRN